MSNVQAEAVRDIVVTVVNRLTPDQLNELIFGAYHEVREQILVPLAA